MTLENGSEGSAAPRGSRSLSGQGRAGRYHHGALRAALISTAVELIGEGGVHNFSLAEASRRLGVAVSAPYAHFADRDDLLAAVAVHAYEVFHAELLAEVGRFETPGDRLAAVARAYVRFAGAHRPLFDLLFEAGLDKDRHPAVKAAEQPIDDAFFECVRAISRGEETRTRNLATAIEATAHGHARLLLDGAFGHGEEAIEQAADRAGRATLALVESRRLL
ncbi:MAG TPA: TetR/AcrR family transcriptional regulator [Gaiellaceae bacterium]|nr:TetR/AcrR family transcriptional regulator [Gaiellaceae bacterium]HET8653312.1 TetR/AcrR family transcriptional regulator [Gaiellaceae bacterium]